MIPRTSKRVGGFAHDRDLVHGKTEWLSPREVKSPLEFKRREEKLRADTERVPWAFDLDPCAPVPELRPWSTAKRHYSIRDNGLVKPWVGRVWCNPPYGEHTEKWLARCSAHQNVTALIFARTETEQFFDHIWGHAAGICFLKGRLRFWELTCKLCGKGLSAQLHKRDRKKHFDHDPVPTRKAVRGGASGAPSVLVAWNQANANAIWDAVQLGLIKGFYIDLGGSVTAP